MNRRAIIAITTGDAAGVGPEIIVKALLSRQIYVTCRPLLVGEGVTMSEVIRLLDSPLELSHVEATDQVIGQFGTIDLLDLHNLDYEEVILGKVCRACGRAAMECIAKAVELALHGKAKAVVTAPINKEATIQAGYGDVGHP
jgi:4-hydroxythreonine-4-phosphate dehydrogenase